MLCLIYISQSLQTFHWLFMEIFFCDSILFGWISLISFHFRTALLRLSMQYILRVVCKSWQWHLGICIDNAKVYFSLSKIFWKRKNYQHNSFAHLFATSIIFLQSFMYLWSSFHLPRGNHWCFRKMFVWIFGVLIH